MAGYARQNSSFTLPEDHQPRNLQTSAIGRQSRRKDKDAGGKEKQRRRGLGVAQLERLRLGAATTSAPATSLPMNLVNPVPVSGTGGTVPLHVGPNYGAFAATSGGISPPPARFSAPGEQFQTRKHLSSAPNVIFPYADRCSLCHQKKRIFIEQNNLVHKGVNGASSSAFTSFVGSNVGNSMNSINGRSATAIYRKNPSFPAGNYMHQGNYAEAANGHKRGSLFMEHDFLPASEKRSKTMEYSANQNDQLVMMVKMNGSEPYFSFSPADMVGGGGGGGADTSCVTTSTSTGGGGGGGAYGSVGASSSIDLSLRLSNY